MNINKKHNKWEIRLGFIRFTAVEEKEIIVWPWNKIVFYLQLYVWRLSTSIPIILIQLSAAINANNVF